MINGLSNFLFFNDSNIDSESEKIIDLLSLDSGMKSRAMLIDYAFPLYIKVLFGRWFLKGVDDDAQA